MSTTNRGWVVTFAAVSINLILGALYAWGVIGKALVMQWQWTKTQAALPFTVSTAAFAIMMVFAGRLQDKIGPRFVAMAGGLMFGLGLITSAYVSTPMGMLLTFGVLGGIGIGLCYSATTPPAIKWFPPARKGVITGIVVSGVGLAAVYVSPLTQYLLKISTIPYTFLFLGGGAVILILVLSQFLTNPPSGYVPVEAVKAGVPTAKAAVARRELDWNEMVKTRQFYQLWLMMVLAASAGLMIIAHVAIIAQKQANWKWGFVPVAMLAIFNTLGRLVSGYLSDRIGRPRTMVLAFVLQAINMWAFVHYTSPALLVFGSAFAGLCYGTIFTLMPSATADFYGVRNLGVNYGLVFTAFGVAGITGPIVAGKICDITGSYEVAYVISAVMLLAAALMAVLTRAPKSVEE
jgi:OFA family oxalate/formate antiporter-like MFS transporter